MIKHELSKRFVGRSLAPVMGLFISATSFRLPPSNHPPTLAGLMWNLLVNSERNAWVVFAGLIKDLHVDYTTRFTTPTAEFYQQIKEDSMKIRAKLADIAPAYPSQAEFYSRSPGQKKGFRNVFRIVDTVGSAHANSNNS
jgi:hypothetical protein